VQHDVSLRHVVAKCGSHQPGSHGCYARHSVWRQGGVDSGESSEVEVWDFRSRDVAFSTNNGGDESRHGMCMHLSYKELPATGRRIIVRGCEDGSVGVWDCTAARWIANTKLHQDAVLSVAMIAGGQRGLSCSADKTVVAWALDLSREGSEVCQPKTTIEIGQRGVGEVALRPDQKLFAVASWDHRVRVYNLKTLKPLALLKYHTNSVNAVAFSSDNGTLASGSADESVAIWRCYPAREKKVQLDEDL